MAAPHYRRIQRPAVEGVNERWLQTWLDTYVVKYDPDSQTVTLPGDASAIGLTIGSLALTPTAAVAATIAPTAYSAGSTFMTIVSDSSWPIATGMVETFIYESGTGSFRIYQVMRGKTADTSYERYSTDGSLWDNWRPVNTRHVSKNDATGYAVVAANTAETAMTQTITVFPSQRFEASVMLTVGGNALDSSGGIHVDSIRADISLDGGSTWTSSVRVRETNPSGSYGSLSAGVVASGAVTGDIVCVVTVNSDKATASYDNVWLQATVGPNY